MPELVGSRDGDVIVARDKREAFVPEITDERLAELDARFTPLVWRDGKLFKIERPDLRRTAFTWDPKTTEEVTDFQEVRQTTTDHYCGYHAFFKPSIAEVLAQVPDDLPEEANAYVLQGDISVYPAGNGQSVTCVFGRIA